MRRLAKPLSGAKHVGRKTTRYSFEVREIEIIAGLPENLSATGLVVQMSRGPKLTTTKEVELTPEMKEIGGGIEFPGQLSFVATLFSSKSGKAAGFSDKRYRVSVLALKPNFGSSKRSLKEVASADLNISEHTSSPLPTPMSLSLDRRAHDGLPLTLSFKLAARPVAAGVGDDDDDAQSESSAFTGDGRLGDSQYFDAGREVDSEAPSEREQDLAGFDVTTARASYEQLAAATSPPSKPPPRLSESAVKRAHAMAAADAQAETEREIEAEFGAALASMNPFDASPASRNPFGRAAPPAEARPLPPRPQATNPFADAPAAAQTGIRPSLAAAAATAFDAEDAAEDVTMALSPSPDNSPNPLPSSMPPVPAAKSPAGMPPVPAPKGCGAGAFDAAAAANRAAAACAACASAEAVSSPSGGGTRQ